MNVEGKAVLVTGASRGIGAAAAVEFARAGAKVVLLARSGDAITRIAGEIGGDAIAVPCDVTRFREVEAAVTACLEGFGRLDIVICNAGVIAPIADLDTADPESWGKAIDINLKGVFHAMRATMQVMKAAGGGTILTVGSGAAHHPLEGWSAYCAAKAGALMLTRAADLEGRAHGVRAISLSPGTVATDMQSAIKASGVNPVAQLDWEDHIPPEWPARALVWMCGPQADAFLGQEISLRDPETRRLVGLA